MGGPPPDEGLRVPVGADVVRFECLGRESSFVDEVVEDLSTGGMPEDALACCDVVEQGSVGLRPGFDWCRKPRWKRAWKGDLGCASGSVFEFGEGLGDGAAAGDEECVDGGAPVPTGPALPSLDTATVDEHCDRGVLVVVAGVDATPPGARPKSGRRCR